ncbi:FMN-dependent oxidoreductase (nitrilotriacetate monooxygenase family) [Actinocorallia herbida]|uniref:FMN-dependent oxidoreductase (Nitrilotriacetate monooxygenase family) n=1 Tax=Actinocorallia herbida TaxID=58109 RepID=A0A3N1CX65_9ACTN|nr:LLM class flavin-dependent oxidoreductase [Actinocorallia herbida]ROO85871.1 FMN-dependent oxidoreductase (nitrilotriacetate monooxygenase family) [Actinocorallia herbida]
MPRPDPLILSAFTMSTASHGNAGLWRHPDDRTARYPELSYWVDLARRLDAGGFDLLFIADAVGQLDVYGGSAREALARAVQTPVTDPLLAVSAMAAATEHLGFGVTVSTTYEYPYLLARKFSTLDHLTGGRIGWNIVTSLLDSAARNIIARDRQIGHDERYAIAQEFLEVAFKLWEGSWEDGAVLRDPVRGIFTDPDKVHGIEHSGRYFSVPGAHLVEPSPQRSPLLLQAGTSTAGREFAARNAELVFVADPRPETLRRNIDDVRRRAVGHGRRPEHLKFITSVTVVVAETDRAAAAKAADLRRFRDTRGGLVLLSALSGVDWSAHDLDRPIEEFETDASRSVLAAVADPAERKRLTLRDHVDGLSGFGGEVLVGGPATVADQLEAYAGATGVDGFNFVYLITPGSFDDLAAHLIPELAKRGRVRERGTPRPIRDALFGTGPTLPADHPGTAFRRATSSAPRPE